MHACDLPLKIRSCLNAQKNRTDNGYSLNRRPKMLESALANTGMADLLDHSISVDPIRLFKTSPESYALVQQHIPFEKQDIVLSPATAGMR